MTRKQTCNPAVRTPRRGLTLLELLLALAGTAVVGMAVTMMLTGVAYGTQSNKDLRTLVTKQMALRARIEAEVRESQVILDQGVGYLILWGEDADDSGTPNKSEIQVIELDAGTEVLTRYAPADGITDVEYALADDFRTITDGFKGDATFPAERWGTEVSSFAITLDDADPQLARFVSFRLGLRGGEVSATAIGGAALRNEASE
ncbi:MAG: hypothetical protein ACE37H_15615 [Phycisphaeraceae bacterium]